MRQKGFATIFGLCLVLVIALVVKGIEESEMNHAYETMNYQAEFELQNAADSGIYEAIELTLKDPTILPMNPGYPGMRLNYQHKFNTLTIKSKSVGTITIETWGERVTLSPYKVNYTKTPSVAAEDKTRIIKNDKGKTIYQEAYSFFSRASVDSTNGKIYRRAFAYVLAEGDATVHFMEVPMSSYIFK